jgi:hypothetical protein
MFHRVVVATLSLLSLVTGPALIANELCPRFVGRWGGPSHTRAVAVDGDHAFFGSCGKLLAADISDPSAPSVVGELAMPGDATDLETTAGRLFAVVLDSIHAIDITSPQALAETGRYSSQHPVVDVAAAGNLLHVATRSGLSVVDVSHPEAMQEIARLGFNGNPVAVAVQDGNAYIAYNGGDYNLHGAIQVVDVTDPQDPQPGAVVELSRFPDPFITINGVAASGGYLYATLTAWGSTTSEVHVFAVADTQPPAFIRGYTIAEPYSISASADGAVYVADGTGIIQLVNGRAIWQLDTPGSARDVAATDGVAAIADETDLQLAGLSAPIGLTGSWRSSEVSRLTGTAVAGDDLIVVADADHGARFLDVSTSGSPTEVSSVERDAVISAVETSGHRVYIADELDRFAVIDAATPQSPSVVGSLVLEQVTDLAAYGSYVYAVAGGGIAVVDASNPASPALVGQLPIDAPVIDLEVYGGLLLVSDDSGLRILDLAEPASPGVVGELTLQRPGNLVVSAGLVYIGNGIGPLAVVDVSDPSQPRIIRELIKGDRYPSFAATGTILALNGVSYYGLSGAEEMWSLWIIDASEADNPTELGAFSSVTCDTMTTIGVNLLCLNDGLMIFDLSDCGGTELDPGFIWWPRHPVAGEPVWFYDTTAGLPTEWHWDFGDGAESGAQNPYHTFSALPVQVTLEVGNGTETRQVTNGVPAAFQVRRSGRRHW